MDGKGRRAPPPTQRVARAPAGFRLIGETRKCHSRLPPADPCVPRPSCRCSPPCSARCSPRRWSGAIRAFCRRSSRSPALLFLPAALGRRRMRRLLISGDVERVIGTWEGSIQRVPYHETMAPLLKATAYASYGWIEAARRALERAVRGPAWDAAIEQRLFVETLLDTFEGDRDAALRKAQALESLPMPSAGLFARRRVALLRCGLAALARAFAHASREGDARILARAAASLAARPLGDALRRGHRRRRPRSREGCAGAALGRPGVAGSERVSHVPRRAPGAGVFVSARRPGRRAPDVDCAHGHAGACGTDGEGAPARQVRGPRGARARRDGDGVPRARSPARA